MTYKLSKREIKFRAWDKKRKKMIFLKKLLPALEDRYILMQYTGLKDKKREEIYEGDILRYKPYHNLGYENEYKIGVVEWGETGDSDDYCHSHHYEWVVNDDSLADIADGVYEGFECEVIGNIFENPELLKEEYEKLS